MTDVAVDAVAAGTVLGGRYKVLRKLGSGGMGSVFEVHDLELDEAVALKLLHPALGTDGEHRQRLRAEVRMARRVSHPNVCRVHDLGDHQGRLFVTMELVRGGTLRSRIHGLRRGTGEPMPLMKRVDVLVQLCSALSAAHRAGVLHRDVKPDNIILERDRAVLTDFGIAALSAELVGSRRYLAGTPAYIAPEALRGEAFDHRVDIYAVGVVAWELIAGQQPFEVPDLDAAIARARRGIRPPILPAQVAELAVRTLLDRALARALEHDPAHRTASVDRLAEEIAEAVRGHGSAGAAFFFPVGPVTGDSATLPSQVVEPATPTVTGVAAVRTPEPEARPTPTGDRTGATPPDTRSAVLTPSAFPRAQVRVATALHFAPAPNRRAGDSQPEGGKPASDRRADAGEPPVEGAGRRLPSAADTRPGANDTDRLERIVIDLGGAPLQVSAGSITALFGAPTALGDDAARAARVACALLSASRGGRIGIDTARVLVRRGAEGLTATGDALDHARALAERAGAGEIRLSPSTARHIAGRWGVAEADAESKDLLLLPESVGRGDARALAPLVGRDRELGLLEELVGDAFATRRPRWATVLGPSGSGKSRLRRELIKRIAERREVDWLVARATPLGEVAPLALLRSADPGWFAAAAREGIHDRPAAFRAARVWLEARAARRPVALLCEDLHWCDDASLGFLDQLATTLDGAPVAVIGFGRENARTIGGDGKLVIDLGPLSTADAGAIVRAVAPAATGDQVAEVVGRAGGNPFFLEELARDLAERRTAAGAIALPATVEAVIQARLDRLDPRAREVACAGAVVGREFWREAARAALPEAIADGELDGILAELEQRAILSPLPPSAVDDERYVFHSALVRDVAYQQLAPRDRRRAHQAVARWLEPRLGSLSITTPGTGRGGAAREDPALLAAIAWHRDQAGDAAGAHQAYRRSGERALALFAHREAASALMRARELGTHDDPRLLELLGDALAHSESIAAGQEVYQAGLTAAGEEPVLRARLHHKLATCHMRRGDHARAVEVLTAGLDLVAPGDRPTPAALTEPAVLAALYGTLGWVLGYQLTDNARGLPFSERAVALLEGTPHKRELAHALGRLGANYMRAGRFAEQLRCNLRNLQIGEEIGDLDMQLTARINLGVVHATLGNLDEAIHHTRQALELCARTQAVTTAALVHSNLAGLLLDAGDRELAGKHLDHAIAAAERAGVRNFLPEAFGFAARLHLTAGDLPGAEAAARRALAAATTPSIDEGIAARVLAGVLLRAGRLDEADAELARAADRLTAEPLELARTRVVQARLADARGDAAGATALRDAARTELERLGAALDVARLEDPTDLR